MTLIRRIALAALVALFIALGTAALITAGDHPDCITIGGREHCEVY